MSETDIRQTTTTQLNSPSLNYSVAAKNIDEFEEWTNTQWSQYHGYYKSIPELKQAIDSLSMWTCGKGWTAEDRDRVTLERMKGWGEDSFDSIMQNMIVVKKINGDAFAEIIRNDKGTLINLKPLNPSRIKIITDKKGVIVRYEETNKEGKTVTPYEPNEILHLCNNRVANENHGISVVESCQWIIDARNEAMTDWRRILHRSTIRVIYVDEDDTTKLGVLRTQYKEAIKKGEVMILPMKPQEGSFQELTAPPIQPFLDWIKYLEDFFYRAAAVPRAILGGTQDTSEAGSKMGYLTFEQVYMTEQRILEQDIWNQLGIRIKFERPVSLKDDMVSSEAANTGQTNFQPSETQAKVGNQK